MSSRRIFFSLIFSLLIYCYPSFAFKLTPMSTEIQSAGKEARTSFQVENDGDKPVPVQIVLAKRIVDEMGKEKYPPAGEDFMVFPTQVILKPGEKRTINVRYMAGSKGDHSVEKAYRVIAEQLPLPLGKEGASQGADQGAGINVLLRYIAALYVLPDTINHKLEVSTAKIEGESLVFSVKNSGTVHEILDKYALKIAGKLQGAKVSKVIASEKDLKGFYGENILAAHERVFSISLKALFPAALKSNFKNLTVLLTSKDQEE